MTEEIHYITCPNCKDKWVGLLNFDGYETLCNICMWENNKLGYILPKISSLNIKVFNDDTNNNSDFISTTCNSSIICSI